MAKKSHKKLRDIARLQSMYGNISMPEAGAMAVIKDTPVSSDPTIQTPITHHASHSLVANDLKGLSAILGLMVVLLVGVYFLVQNTGLADALVRLGHRLTS